MFQTLDLIKSAPGYIGSWPKAGFVDWMPKLGGEPDVDGFTYSQILGLWRLQSGDFSLLAFDRAILEDVKPHLKTVAAERPAQIRVEVGDLAASQLRSWVDVQNYRRSWQTSIANPRMLNMLSQQFGLSPLAAEEIAIRLLDVELVCSLGGDYELREISPGRLVWCSTAWPEFADPVLPSDYSAPLLKWFRGMLLEVVANEEQFVVHGYLDFHRNNDTRQLPSFKLFEGFGNLFSSKNDAGK
jgi:hypothetical protein